MEKLTLLEKLASIRDEAAFTKDKKIDTRNGSYDIWTESSVLNTLRPLFKKYRVFPIREDILVHYSDPKSVKITVKMRMLDLDSEESVKFSGIGTGFDSVDKDSGKASTYAVKDAYLKLFTAVSGLDPDNTGSDETEAVIRGNALNLLVKVFESKFFHR